MDPFGDIPWDNDIQRNDRTAFRWLQTVAKDDATRRRRYPTDKQRKRVRATSSILVTLECRSDQLLVTIDVNVEDKPPGWKGWSSPFLHLSIQLLLSLEGRRIHQQLVDAYMTHTNREVTEDREDYREKVEQYTRGLLPLKYIRGTGWQLKSARTLRNSLESWENI
jgi:hypothetical protein